MANEDVSRIMQNKPHLRYSLAFVHIKVCRKAASAFSFRACMRARTLWNYIARASVIVSQLLPHSGVNYVYLEHPLRSHLSVSSFIRVIFRVKMHSFARDISLCLHVSSLYSPLNRIYLTRNFEKIDPSKLLSLSLYLVFRHLSGSYFIFDAQHGWTKWTNCTYFAHCQGEKWNYADRVRSTSVYSNLSLCLVARLSS